MIPRDPRVPLADAEKGIVPPEILGRCGFVVGFDPKTWCGEPALYKVTNADRPRGALLCARHAQCARHFPLVVKMESI